MQKKVIKENEKVFKNRRNTHNKKQNVRRKSNYSIITLNVTRLNNPIKWKRLLEWIRKEDLTI